MRVLVVAHPDDEVIWFDDPDKYDRIIIVFGDFGDERGAEWGNRRRKALAKHPLQDRITHLDIRESNYWRDKEKAEDHTENYNTVCAFLRTLEADEVTTHDANGEYGHSDHILVHKACMMTLNCPVNGRDPKLYRAIRKVYKDAQCWTWY